MCHSPVDPGEQHVCTSWQSFFSKGNTAVGLSSFIAEAGKIYYFRVRATSQGDNAFLLDMEPVNNDQGSYMVLKTKISDWHARK
jgi:hypothetical protein